MHIRLLVIFLWISGFPAAAQPLTLAECREIVATYNVTPDECAAPLASNALRTTFPTDRPTGSVSENHVFFPDGGDRLDTTAKAQLAGLAAILKGKVLGQACLQLIGHSDSTGGLNANLAMGLDRANAVNQELLRLNIDRFRIEDTSSAGEASPLANFSDRSKWQRRVEIRARTCTTKM